MGHRAVISTKDHNDKSIGIYVHWNGDYYSIEAFLLFCKASKFRSPEIDNYGWAALCTVIGCYFGNGLSVGIDTLDMLDCDNGDHGMYIIEDWKIIGREYYEDNPNYDMKETELIFIIKEINNKMPDHMKLSNVIIEKEVKEYYN